MIESEPRSRRRTLHGAIVVLVIMTAMMPLAFMTLSGITLDNRVETWLPASDPDALVLSWFHEQFEDHASMLVSWEGSSLNDPRVEAFAEQLAGPPDDNGNRAQLQKGISGVRTPRDLIGRMLANNVDRESAVSRLTGILVGSGPLKVRLTAEGKLRLDHVVSELHRRAHEDLGIDVIVLPAVDEQGAPRVAKQSRFERDEYANSDVDDPYPPPPPHDFQIRWEGMTPQAPTAKQLISLCNHLIDDRGQKLIADCRFSPGAPVAVLVTMSDSGDDQVEQTLTEIRAAAEKVGIPAGDLHLGGSPYGRSELNRAAAGSLWNPQYPLWNLPKRSPVLTSALVGIGMAFLVLRSVRLATLVLLTAVFVATVTTALLPATGHALNMVLIVLPNLLIVVTSSGAIHLANYWRHEAEKGLEGSVSRAVRIAWLPCVLCSVTTAIGLISLLTSSLSPVREFGLFSAIGCLISLATILIGFPSMLRLWRGQVPSLQDVDQRGWRRLGEWLYRYRTLVTVASLGLFAVGIFGLQWFRTESKVIRYFSPESRIVGDYRFLEENLAGVAPVEVVVSFDSGVRESVDRNQNKNLAVNEVDDEAGAAAAKGDGNDGGAGSRAVLTSVERMELVRRIKDLVAAHPEISGAFALCDFRPPLAPPPDDAPFLVKAKYRRTVSGIDEFLRDAQHESQQGLVAVNPVSLSTQIGDRAVVIPQGAELWRIRAQVALLSDLDYGVLTADLDRLLSQALKDTPGTSHFVTGMAPLFLRTQDAVVESLIESFGLAFAVIAVVMMIPLRHPLAGVIMMLPNVLPVVFVFGLISWIGVPVDIGTMVTASIALGIAVDDTLHQLTWFQAGLQQGLSRRDAMCQALAHCGTAMSQTSSAIGFGLLMLAWSDLLLVSRFGWLMAALIAAALLADILLTPALLAGPVGQLMERRLRRLRAAAAGTKEETEHFSEEEFTTREISGSASPSISR